MYFFTRVLIVIMLLAPASLCYVGEISIGELCIVIALALILVEVSDISSRLDKKDT